jgi:DNA helicase-2/ATP-dependent DNA helicase PcrA
VNDILSKLNDAQRAAVEQTEGPMMVIAGAGSGKTRVLTFKIAHLIDKGTDPFNILALTFTNKAAKEMKERIMNLVGSDARNVWMGTFHSIFARILRIEGSVLGYPSNFTIYDTDDSKSLIKSIVKEQELDPKVYAPNVVLGRISACKNNLISAKSYLQNAELMQQDKIAGKPMLGHIYNIYDSRLFKSSSMDFDDLLFKTNILLRDHPDIMYRYQNKFKYILVDEYQDTNYSQYIIIKRLAANNENICVVGDDAQSIYAFRGANIQNILNFQKDYSDTKVFKLEQNYRSTQVIVKAANGIIDNNQDQIKKSVWTSNGEGEKIPIIKAATDTEEGVLVASSIFEAKMNHQLQNDEFAILYRTNSQSRSMEEALRKRNIPYKIFGGLSFYRRKEIKDLLAYFRLTINPNDEEAIVRVINYPARGIGKTTMQKLIIEANNKDKSLWDVLLELEYSSMGFNGGTRNKLLNFVTMIKSFQAQLKSKSAFDLAKDIAKTSGVIGSLYEDKTPEGLSRYENIEELLNGIKEFTDAAETDQENPRTTSLDEFMQDVALLTDADEKEKDDTKKVSLMTIHAAKGLEFPYVYIVGMEENLFPSIQSLNSRSDLEEERRLFYVALTRAERKAHLSYSENRYKWGNLTFCEPSRFISEIETEYIDLPGQARKQKTMSQTTSHQPKLDPRFKSMKGNMKPKGFANSMTGSVNDFAASSPDEIKSGMTVEHQRFGVGEIVKIEGMGSNKKATVDFPNIGKKHLLLKFAKLRIVK